MGYNSAHARDICEIFASLGGFQGLTIECCQGNFALIRFSCHGNEIWAKMGYSLVSARDIYEIFASIGGFRGWAI